MKFFYIFLIVIFFNVIFTNNIINSAESGSVIFINKKMNSVLKRFSDSLKFRTVSIKDESKGDFSEFYKFHRYLEKSFPNIHKTMRKELIGKASLLYKWEGSNRKLKPVIFAAHMDVVPAENEADWKHPPFGGIIAEGYFWGRGARDYKSGLMSLMEAAEYLISKGCQPKRSVYFAFGHDEEIQGFNGAAKIADILKKRGVDAEFVLDEGGGITKGIIDGTEPDKLIAMVSTAEKGYLTLKLQAKSGGGHSASSSEKNPIVVLSEAIVKLNKLKFDAVFDKPVTEMFEALGPELNFQKEFLFSNLWLTKGIVKKIMLSGHDSASMISTTLAFTMMHAGTVENAIPDNAEVLINIRMLPGDSAQKIIDLVTKQINDKDVLISIQGRISEAPPISDKDTEAFKTISDCIKKTFKAAIVVPSITTGTTDIRHYSAVSKNLYRFAPSISTKTYSGNGHKNDERLPVENYKQYCEFYYNILAEVTSR